MRLLTFASGDDLALGLVTPRGVLDLARAAAALGLDAAVAPSDLSRLGHEALKIVASIEEAAAAEPAERSTGWYLDEATLSYGPCITEPGKVLCVGLNYARHAAESGMEPPTTPVLFGKFANALAAHAQPIVLPGVSEEYDYEAELVVVIGSRAHDVPVEDALRHVLGYCNGNDVSARDLQTRTSQWLLGKTLDRFLPIGPYLVTADEVPDPQSLSIRCWLTDDLRQDSSTADMIFSVAEIVSYVSRHFALEPGDIIATGTPEGVIFGRASREWMRPGDVAIVEIGPLGRLVNPFVAPARSAGT